MKPNAARAFSAVVTLVFLTFSAAATAAPDDLFSREKIVALLYRINEYQRTHPSKERDRDWVRATYYTGVMALYHTTKDTKILDQAMEWARRNDFEVGQELKLPANRMTCGQTYLELYFTKKDPAMIAKMRTFMDEQIASGVAGRVAWFYCDTLYVGPPALAMMGHATGERKYYDYLHKMYWDVAALLFDKPYGLFYRDARFKDAKTKNGRKVFWSRGNGWVIAGIPRILTYLPEDDPQRERYLEMFRALAASIARVQGADGLWRANLGDPDEVPNPETSGSAFFCYAMAWGINNGHLDRATFLPVVRKAWQGLVTCVDEGGRLGYVQPPGDAPRPADREMTHEYAAGAFLLAGSEMAKRKARIAKRTADNEQ